MDNLRRRFNSPTKSVPPTAMGAATTPEPEVEQPEPEVDPERKSVFHAPLPVPTPTTTTPAPKAWGPGAVREAEARVADHLAGVEAFCGTGAAAVGQLAGMLRGSRYAGVADQCRQRLEDVQRATKAEVAQVAIEVKATLAKVSGGDGPRPKSDENGLQDSASEEDIKLVASAFTRLMQLHCQFLLTASEVLTPLSKYVNDGTLPEPNDKSDEASQSKPAAGQLSQSNSSPQENSQSAAGIQGNEQDSTPKSPTAETKSNINTVHAVGSPSGLRKISSFFSKLARSGSVPSEGPQSSFYVSIPKEEQLPEGHNKENRDETRQSTHSAPLDHEEEGSITATLNKLNFPPGATDLSQVMPGLPPNGRLATQEELDSVIDLLSGGQRSPMQVIPENVPSHHVTSKVPIGPMPPYPHHPHQHHLHAQHPLFAVLPATDAPPPPLPPTGHHHHDGGGGHNGLYRTNHHHRRSDSLLSENFPRDQKTNTWPYRPHARSAAGDLGPTSLVHTIGSGVYDGGGGAADVDYTRYLAAVKAMKAGSSGSSGTGPLGGSLGGQGPWSSGDSGLHRSWPMHLFNHDGTDASRNWSTVGDSSSCSDESSTGDTPWTMGLDLVGAVSDKRRHSSGEESFPGPPPPGHVTETRPRSVENLLDSKSTNTWPPKQPWAKLGVPGGPREEGPGLESSGQQQQHAGHPPLTMQWSDPLTNRPLSAWDGGRYDTQLL